MLPLQRPAGMQRNPSPKRALKHQRPVRQLASVDYPAQYKHPQNAISKSANPKIPNLAGNLSCQHRFARSGRLTEALHKSTKERHTMQKKTKASRFTEVFCITCAGAACSSGNIATKSCQTATRVQRVTLPTLCFFSDLASSKLSGASPCIL